LVACSCEGVQKLLYPDALGGGRSIRIPAASAMAPFAGVLEILGGLRLVGGLLTRSRRSR
jgi:uncharacterized membrane protein YphA (DoxX/SURF4 family)